MWHYNGPVCSFLPLEEALPLPEIDFSKKIGLWEKELGEFSFRGYAHRSDGGADFDPHAWVEYRDDLRTVGDDFEVHTSIRGRDGIPVFHISEAIGYRIGLGEYSKRTAGAINREIYGGVNVKTLDFNIVQELHLLAVASFEAKMNKHQVEAAVLRAAREWKKIEAERGH